MKYRIELTRGQAETLCAAAEVLARLGAGQVEVALDYLPFFPSCEQRREVERVLGLGSGGWHPPKALAKTAWDLYQVISYRLSWDKAVEDGVIESVDSPRKWPEMIQVWYDEPMQTGEEPLAVMEATDEH
jgi:hypothetical protein